MRKVSDFSIDWDEELEVYGPLTWTHSLHVVLCMGPGL